MPFDKATPKTLNSARKWKLSVQIQDPRETVSLKPPQVSRFTSHSLGVHIVNLGTLNLFVPRQLLFLLCSTALQLEQQMEIP